MYKRVIAGLCGLIMCTALFAQDPPVSAPNEVPGLKITPTMSVNYDEGFVNITADTKGTTKWLILSSGTRVKFQVHELVPNEITVAIPPVEGTITVFAIAAIDNKLTEFARTDINVKGPVTPAPNPVPPNINLKLPLHLTIIEDPNKPTGLDNINLREKLKNKQILLRVFVSTNTIDLNKFKFDVVVKNQGVPLMILQDNTGNGLIIDRLPADEATLLKKLEQYVGGFN